MYEVTVPPCSEDHLEQVWSVLDCHTREHGVAFTVAQEAQLVSPWVDHPDTGDQQA